MFQPVLPLSGYTGWRFLERTLDVQQTAFNEAPQIERATSYFRENISKITTAEALVADRQLLEVALGAFGLDDDINNTYFIKTILEEGTLDDDALANRLADSRYKEFAEFFGFGDFSTPRTVLSTFPDDIINRFEAGQFEQAVGEQNPDLRLALNFSSTMESILATDSSNDVLWFKIMGNPPARKLFETALGLPASFAQIDIDRQLEIFKERSMSRFGTNSVSDFSSPDTQDDIIRNFLVRSEMDQFAQTSSGSIALALLQGQ